MMGTETAAMATTFDLSGLGSFVATFARVGAFARSAPLIGDRIVSTKVRIGVVVMVAMALTTTRAPLSFDALPALLPGEILLGLLMGFAVRLVFAGAETGGQLIGLTMGLGFAAAYDPMQEDESLPTRRIGYCLGGLAFLTAGGLEHSVRALAVAAPDMSTLAGGMRTVISRGGEVLVLAVRVAAPVLIAGIIVNVGAGLASRAAPALNVFSITFALVILVCGAVLIATAPGMVRDIGAIALRAMRILDEVARP